MLDLDGRQEGTDLLLRLRRQNEGLVRPRSQGSEKVLFVFESIDGPLFQRAVDPHVGDGIDPGSCLMVEVLIVKELATVEEPFSHVPDGAFDFAFGLGSVGPAGSDPEAPVVGEAKELGVLQDVASIVSVIVDDDGLHLVEEQLGGDAAEVGKRALQATEENLHGLTPKKLQPKEAGIAQHYEECIPFAPRQAEVAKVHLSLAAWRRLEADDGLLWGLRPDRPDVLLHLGVAAGIASGLNLLEESYGREFGIGLKPGQDDALVGVDLTGNRRSRAVVDGLGTQVSVQLPVLDPAVNGSAADAKHLGHRGYGHALFEIMSKQHALLPSDHRVSIKNEETPS
jgi:hypothetical protein